MMTSKAKSRLLFTILAAAVALPSPALAHLVTTGMGPVYDGIGHLLLTPEDLVPVLALSCYCGLRGARAGRWAMFLLPAAWCSPSTFWVTRVQSGRIDCISPIALCPRFGSAAATISRRHAYQFQTSAGSSANPAGLASFSGL